MKTKAKKAPKVRKVKRQPKRLPYALPPGDRTNSDRASWAREAWEAYCACHGADPDMQTSIKDLITDLCHLMQRSAPGLKPGSVANVANSAVGMYLIEQREDLP